MRSQNGLVPKSYIYSLFVRRGILCTTLHQRSRQLSCGREAHVLAVSMYTVFSTPDFAAKDPVEFHVFTKELLRLQRGGLAWTLA